eukprot:jgi/Tetstr1/429641/TSEL_019539.t1
MEATTTHVPDIQRKREGHKNGNDNNAHRRSNVQCIEILLIMPQEWITDHERHLPKNKHHYKIFLAVHKGHRPGKAAHLFIDPWKAAPDCMHGFTNNATKWVFASITCNCSSRKKNGEYIC